MRGSELMSNWFMSGRVVMALFGVAGALVLGCAANLAVCAAGSSAAACRSLAAGQAVVAQEVGFDTVRARRSAGENFDRACYAGDGDACEEAIAYWSSLRILSGLESGACSIDGLRGSGNNGRSGARCLQEFPVQVESGHSYTFSTAGASSGDTFLRVSGACNCANDDANGSVASECECRATQTGLATICASTYAGNAASWNYSVRSSDGGTCGRGGAYMPTVSAFAGWEGWNFEVANELVQGRNASQFARKIDNAWRALVWIRQRAASDRARREGTTVAFRELRDRLPSIDADRVPLAEFALASTRPEVAEEYLGLYPFRGALSTPVGTPVALSGRCSIDGLRGSGGDGRSGARCLQEFSVQVESGHSYTFSTVGRSSGDTFLRVSGACNCSNDDARNSVASECECRATQTGLATICASTYSGNSASWDYSVRSSDGGGCAGGDTPGQVAARGSQVIVDPTEDPVGYRVRAHLASLRFAAVDSRVRTQSVPQALQELYTFHDQFPEFALEEPLVYRLSLELLEPAVARRYVDSYPNGAHVAEMQRRWLEQETAALVARPCSSETETRLVTIWRDAGHGNTPIETRDRAAQRTLECLSDGQLRGQRSEWLQIVARVFVGAPGATRAIDELEQMRVQEARRQESERADQEAAEEREEAADRAANQRAANARQAAASAALAQCMARCRADRAVCARVCQNYR